MHKFTVIWANIAADAATESRARFTCEPRALADAVALLASRVIERRNRVPIASCLMIDARPDGTLALTGGDFDLQATVTIAADVEAPGAFCTDAANLKAMLAKLKKTGRDAVAIEDAQEGRAVLVIGRNRFNLPTLPVDDFPRLDAPTVGKRGPLPLSAFTVDRGQLVRDLAALAPCISSEESRYYLNGIAMQRREMAGRERLVMVATNGTEIGIASRALPAGADAWADCILPRKAVALIGHAAKLANPTDEIEVSKAERFGFRIGNVEIIAKEIDGTFPEWERCFDEQLAPTDEIDGPMFPDLLPNGAPVATLEKLAKAFSGEVEWTDAARGKLGRVCRDPDMLFGVMNLAGGNEPVKGYHYSSEADREAARRYMQALAEARGMKPHEQNCLIVENGTYRGLTIGKSEFVPYRYEERPNFETLTMEQVRIEGGQVWADGSYSLLMPAERAKVQQDYSVTVEGDTTYPVAVNASASKIHLSTAQVRDLVGESAFETMEIVRADGSKAHILKWLWDDGASRFLAVRADGRCFNAKRGGEGALIDRAEIEAVMAGEIAPEIEVPASAPEAAQEPEEALCPVTTSAEPVEALRGAEIAPEADAGMSPEYNSPDRTGLDAQGEAMAAFIETLEPLPAVSTGAPTVGKAKRTPAHERAIRRAWAERRERHLARAALDAANAQFRKVDSEREMAFERMRELEMQSRQWQQTAANRLAEIHRQMDKRRRSTLLARQRGYGLVMLHNVARARLDELQADLAKARQVPTYLDDTGMERHDAAAVAFDQGRHALEKSESLERTVEGAKAVAIRQQRAIETLADELEAMTARAIKAERALAAVTARRDGWPPAVRTVGVNFALAG